MMCCLLAEFSTVYRPETAAVSNDLLLPYNMQQYSTIMQVCTPGCIGIELHELHRLYHNNYVVQSDRTGHTVKRVLW